MRQRDWAKLDMGWTDNYKVRKLLRRFGPAAGAYWTMLIAKSYASSHHIDNPDGIIECSLADLAELLSDNHSRVEMWQAMINAKLITIKGGDWKDDSESKVWITLVEFSTWQHPRLSNPRRQLEFRENQKSRDLQGNVTEPYATVRDRNLDRDRDRDRDKETLLPSRAPAHTPARTHEDHAVNLAIKRLATHLAEEEEIWKDRIQLWWTANPHTTPGDLVAALIHVTTKPRSQLRNPYAYFQRVAKRENHENRKHATELKAANPDTDERHWTSKWAELLDEQDI